MRRLIAILLIGFLLLSGCASKNQQAKPPVNQTNIGSNQNTSAQPPPSSPPTPPNQNGTMPLQNSSADDQLDKGLGMFDFTVDPLISDSGYGGTMPK